MLPEAREPGCADYERYLQAYVDGEFLAEDRPDIEQHLGGCPSCSRTARQQAAFKAGLKAAAPRPRLPDSARARLTAALVEEARVHEQPRWRATAYRILPAAAAALMVGALLGSTHRFSPVAAEAISNHRRDLPLEVAGSAAQVSDWFRPKVDFAVSPPQMPSGRLVGARLAQIRDRPAAYLLYDVGGHRVSMFVFDPADLPLDARRRRTAAGNDVFLDDERGYHVAIWRRGGLGYASASELDDEGMFQLVSSTMRR